MIKTVALLCVITSCSFVFLYTSLNLSLAQVMQSGNFQIQSDSINFAGGLSSSTNYVLESTAGEVGTGNSNSTNYALRAGYQQMQAVYLAISAAANVSMTPSISGVSGGESNGSTTVTVITDSPSGYQLTIESLTNPSLQSPTASIADYVPTGNPDFSFITGVGDAHFGFSPEGVDIVARFKDNASLCNVGGGDTTLACWDGLSVTPKTIARATNANHPLGSTTTIRFKVGVGGGVGQVPGIYTATTTLTALPL